ncbi:MAG: hypothetical protein ACLQUY_28735 [Ktedonobacterales bacterium]
MSDETAEEVYQPDNPLAISHPVPALRLNQRETGLEMLDKEGSAPPEPSLSPQLGSGWMHWIRPLRGISGLLLVALAWAGLLVMVLLYHGATQMPLKLWPPNWSVLVPLVDLLAALWIGLVVAMSMLVGSFLLWLAITVRGW